MNTKNISMTDIVTYYKSYPMTIKNVCDKFHISHPTVSKILKENNIQLWPKFRISSPELVEDYFENINTEEKAYFLGLIFTDGNVFVPENGVSKKISLSLKDEDLYLIEAFKKEIHSNKSIVSDNRGCHQIMVSSNIMADTLLSYNIIPRKSGKEIFPEKMVDNDMLNHFVRGVFDGDGSAGFYRRNGRNVHRKTIVFCNGSEEFLLKLADILWLNAGVSLIKPRYEAECYALRYTRNDDLESLISYIYCNSNIFMKRKWNVCKMIVEEVRKYRDN